MLCRDLIKVLEDMIKKNEPYEEVMGEAEIMIDVFEKADDGFEKEVRYIYKGIDHNIIIEPSSDGVYRILSRFQESRDD